MTAAEFGRRAAGEMAWPCEYCGKMLSSKKKRVTARFCDARCRKLAWMSEQASNPLQDSLFGAPAPVKSRGRRRSAPGRALDGSGPPQSLTVAPAQISAGACPTASAFFIPPTEAELGAFVGAGGWDVVMGCWQAVAEFRRGYIVAEVYSHPDGGYSGHVVWTSRGGVPFRYSHYLRNDSAASLRAELTEIVNERLGIMLEPQAGEGGQ